MLSAVRARGKNLRYRQCKIEDERKLKLRAELGAKQAELNAKRRKSWSNSKLALLEAIAQVRTP